MLNDIHYFWAHGNAMIQSTVTSLQAEMDNSSTTEPSSTDFQTFEDMIIERDSGLQQDFFNEIHRECSIEDSLANDKDSMEDLMHVEQDSYEQHFAIQEQIIHVQERKSLQADIKENPQNHVEESGMLSPPESPIRAPARKESKWPSDTDLLSPIMQISDDTKSAAQVSPPSEWEMEMEMEMQNIFNQIIA